MQQQMLITPLGVLSLISVVNLCFHSCIIFEVLSNEITAKVFAKKILAFLGMFAF